MRFSGIRLVFWERMATFAFCCLLPLSVLAEDSSWLVDFVSGPPSPTPSWIRQLPADPQKIFDETSFEITPPPRASDLLITVNFNEQAGGFLKVFWKAPNDSQTLSENLYEGIGMPNQRSLLVSQLTLKEKGVVTFQCSQKDLQIYNIQWQWMEPKIVAASGDAFSLAAINSDGKALTMDEVSGDPLPAVVDQWKGSFISSSLIEKPERIELGLEFQPQLDSLPLSARLEGQLAGLPLDKNLTVWINGHPSPVSLEIPDLADPGYQQLDTGVQRYVGWRKLQVWIPPAWMQVGNNKIQFSWGNPSSENLPLAVKNLNLQLNFSQTPNQPSSPAPDAPGAPL